MGILDYRTPATPISSSYLDFYRNYRAPAYQQQFAAESSATAQDKTESSSKPTGYGLTDTSGGSGYASAPQESDRVGGMGLSSGQEKAAAMMANLAIGMTPFGALAAPVNLGLQLAGQPTIGERIAASLAQPGYNKSDEGAFGGTKAMFEGAPVEVSYADLASLPASSSPSESSYSAFGDSSLAGDVASGNWGGSADSDGWKNGGMIRNKRGLLDGADTSMKNSAPHRGLLQGPITKERDNIPAVNKTTGEKIAVESGEFVMTRKAVKKKGVKFFEKINKEAEGK